MSGKRAKKERREQREFDQAIQDAAAAARLAGIEEGIQMAFDMWNVALKKTKGIGQKRGNDLISSALREVEATWPQMIENTDKSVLQMFKVMRMMENRKGEQENA